MADVELTELQTRIYELVTEKESISKKKVASALDMQVRSVSSPIKALLDRGVLVEDEYGEYSIAAGVREEVDNGYVQVPAPSTPEPEPAKLPEPSFPNLLFRLKKLQ
jgi:predicted DNA-binding transcriptional regulator